MKHKIHKAGWDQHVLTPFIWCPAAVLVRERHSEASFSVKWVNVTCKLCLKKKRQYA